jgi:hypothetical protein
MPPLAKSRRQSLVFFAILGLYFVLLLPTLARQGISWDEQTDLLITRDYLNQPAGWLVGSQIDLSQTRLPMFAVSLVYTLFHTDSLLVGRLVSAMVGALALVGVYTYCRLRLEPERGLLAAGLLAVSPFYLSFARVAFTETDIYLACAFAWLLVCLARLQAQATLGRGAVAGLVFGLALSAKFTALAALPALWYAAYQAVAAATENGEPRAGARVALLWSTWLLLTGWAGWQVVAAASAGRPRFWAYPIVLAAWLLPLAWATWRRRQAAPWYALAAFSTSLAFLTFLVLPPEHLTNPLILRALADRASNEMAFDPAFVYEAAALHLLCILIKSSPLIGAGLLLSCGLSLASPIRRRLGVPLLLNLGYFTALVCLPLAQTFYSVPLLPALAIVAADQFWRAWASRRWLALSVALVALALLLNDFRLCYPDYNLNGYQYLGARLIAGRPSIGYRSVAQLPSDGVQQVLEWLNTHAPPGARVRTYLLELHIIEAFAPSPAYRIENGFSGPLSPDPDYVLVEINTQIRQSFWIKAADADVFKPYYDSAWLAANYTQVFTVRRAFGLEMASVWQRKRSGISLPGGQLRVIERYNTSNHELTTVGVLNEIPVGAGSTSRSMSGAGPRQPGARPRSATAHPGADRRRTSVGFHVAVSPARHPDRRGAPGRAAGLSTEYPRRTGFRHARHGAGHPR